MKTTKPLSPQTPPESSKDAGAGCISRLVRDLTGITARKRNKILRMIERLEDELDDNGLIMFGGGSGDYAILMHRETGIHLGIVDNYGVFMGGDLPMRRSNDGIEYSIDLSPTSGDFANVAVRARRVHASRSGWMSPPMHATPLFAALISCDGL